VSAIAAASRSRPVAINFTSAGDAPFCGANSGAAPSGPTNGVCTSVSATTRFALPHPAVQSASVASAPPPSGSAAPFTSVKVHPSPRAAPTPPSTLADPPSPTTTVTAPRSTASTMSSPTPRLVASSGLRRSAGSSAIPHALAHSKIAVSASSQPSSACTGAPSGPVTATCSRSDVGSSTASSSPSPPSATGHASTLACGNARRAPCARASATSRAPMVPLNAVGATRIVCVIAALRVRIDPGPRHNAPHPAAGLGNSPWLSLHSASLSRCSRSG
jgi:hypothetical protein